jgi:tetratricopeptide (TPR) repeat protein
MMDQSESTAFVRSYYHLYAADALRTSNEAEAASHYIQSIEILPANVDAIIGLYKLKETEELQSLRREKLKHSVTELRTEIRRYDEFLKKYNSEFVESFFDRLANNLNSLAWLIANTEGDFGEAVLLSRRACLLDPDHAEYLDTLAHCYFAAGKWKDAVEQQRKACELKPHHPDLKRALSRFEEKLATSQKQ